MFIGVLVAFGSCGGLDRFWAVAWGAAGRGLGLLQAGDCYIAQAFLSGAARLWCGALRALITEHPNDRLDGSYTIFGQCDDASVKVVEAIARVPRDEHNRPLKPVVIRRITFEGVAAR